MRLLHELVLLQSAPVLSTSILTLLYAYSYRSSIFKRKSGGGVGASDTTESRHFSHTLGPDVEYVFNTLRQTNNKQRQQTSNVANDNQRQQASNVANRNQRQQTSNVANSNQ